jgi:hypothetical protein
MNTKMKAALASYARSFVVAVSTAYGLGQTDLQDLLIAGLVAVVGPAIRAVNPNDASFGIIADFASKELNKLAKADKRKTKKK